MILRDKSVVLGICGGIAAYKVAALCSHLVKAGAIVDVIMTEAAQKFVAALTFQALTHRPVVTEMFSLLAETEIGHVSLASRADLLIIAPATANTIAKLATGIADNMLTTTALSTRAPILLVPAMESHMWSNPLTQANVERLQQMRDLVIVGPAEGRLDARAVHHSRVAGQFDWPGERTDADESTGKRHRATDRRSLRAELGSRFHDERFSKIAVYGDITTRLHNRRSIRRAQGVCTHDRQVTLFHSRNAGVRTRTV